MVTLARMQQIAAPLEETLKRFGFSTRNNEVTLHEDAVYMTSMTRDAESHIDYTLEVEKDLDRGACASDSSLRLTVDLFLKGHSVNILKTGYSSNMPAQEMLRDFSQSDLLPKLERRIVPLY